MTMEGLHFTVCLKSASLVLECVNMGIDFGNNPSLNKYEYFIR